MAVHKIMKRLEERGLAKKHKQGVYLIERSAAEEVLTALREWI
jgi:predicted transcriptional regulator of viral defense system